MPRLSIGLEQVFTNLGIVGSGYKLYFFATETTTPKTTYSDEGLTIANTNPIVLDAAGRPEVGIWGADPAQYRMALGTPDSTISTVLLNPVVDADPVDNYNTGSIVIFNPIPTAYWGVTEGTSTHYTLDPALVNITSYSNTQTFFVDFHTPCGAAPDININNLGAINLKKYTGAGTKVALEAGDLQVQRYLMINDGVDIVVLNPEIVYNLKGDNLTATNTINGALFSSKYVAISNNATDANNDVDFGAGTIFDKVNNTGFVSAAITKRLDAVWVAGTGNGGLDTGSKANSTYYYCYAIYNPTTNEADAIFSTDPSAPALPVDYTRYAYVGNVRTNGSGNILPFQQETYSRFRYKTPIVDRSYSNIPTSPTTLSLTVAPNKIAINTIRVDSSGAGASAGQGLLCPTNNTDLSASTTNYDFILTNPGGSNNMFTFVKETLVDSSSQVSIDGSAAIGLEVLTTGWIDPQL